MAAKDLRAPRSEIPSVDRLLIDPAFEPAIRRFGRIRARDAVRDHLSEVRARWNESEGAALTAEEIARAVAHCLETQAIASIRPVLNLTGTVLHTNLGRALLPESAIEAITQVAGAPCNLEFDLGEGGRGERDGHVEELVSRLTGAEAAVIVNNNAAAVLLAINSLAMRREVIVSRGELIEIGAQFRIPDIMSRAGARLREVGTTNRTYLRDYEESVGKRTGMIMKVHASNYRIEGFTSAVKERDLAALAHRQNVPFVIDLGSGTLIDLRLWGLPHEPTAREAIDAGADLVTFSGDKLLGGPQCGIVAGTRELIARLRKNPLRRALRVDKLILAALEQVLRLYLEPDRLSARLPTLRLLARPASEIRGTAERFLAALKPVIPASWAIDVVSCSSQIGSGAQPVETLPSFGVRIRPSVARRERSAAARAMAAAFRKLPLPVIGRIDDDALLLDCRCLVDESRLFDQLGALSANTAA